MTTPTAPALVEAVHYRGRYGLQTMRAAIVTATASSLDHRGVETGQVPALTDEWHVHLWVYTPAVSGPNAAAGGFAEFNVPHGVPGSDGRIPPGTWCRPSDQISPDTSPEFRYLLITSQVIGGQHQSTIGYNVDGRYRLTLDEAVRLGRAVYGPHTGWLIAGVCGQGLFGLWDSDGQPRHDPTVLGEVALALGCNYERHPGDH